MSLPDSMSSKLANSLEHVMVAEEFQAAGGSAWQAKFRPHSGVCWIAGAQHASAAAQSGGIKACICTSSCGI